MHEPAQFSLTEFVPVGDGVFVARAEPDAVNAGVVVGRDGCLVVDTGSSPAQGAEIRAAAERVAGVPVVAAVVTHHHHDHLFGLGAFADVATYGHATLVASLEATRNLPGILGRLGLTPGDVELPSSPFNLAVTVDLGDRHVELVHFGPAHTPGDVVAIVPDAHVVFAGDLLEEPAPDFGEDCTVKGWPHALDGILGLLCADTVVVPGHGQPLDRDAAVLQRGEIAGVWAQAEHLVGRGVTAAQALANEEWSFPAETMATLLPLVYAQLAAEGKTPARRLPLLGGR